MKEINVKFGVGTLETSKGVYQDNTLDSRCVNGGNEGGGGGGGGCCCCCCCCCSGGRGDN